MSDMQPFGPPSAPFGLQQPCKATCGGRAARNLGTHRRRCPGSHAPAVGPGFVNVQPQVSSGTVAVAWFIAVLMLGYVLPWAIAASRGKPDHASVAVRIGFPEHRRSELTRQEAQNQGESQYRNIGLPATWRTFGR